VIFSVKILAHIFWLNLVRILVKMSSRAAFLSSKNQKERAALDQIKQHPHQKSDTKSKTQTSDKKSKTQTSDKKIEGFDQIESEIIEATEKAVESAPALPLLHISKISPQLVHSPLIESFKDEKSAKASASVLAFEEVLSASFSTTAVKPRSVPFPNFEEWK